MKTILTIFIVLFSQQVLSVENLSQIDHVGTWNSQWTVIDGEKQTLTISQDKSSVFVRNFKDGSKQVFESNNIEYLDDLLIIKYRNNKGELNCKLVLSGWYSYGKYMFYGTIYMYHKGKLYNGLTVSLKRVNQGGE
ncbi:hypothetical protein [Kaarinaea lacus]